MADLERDENYFLFVQDLAGELMFDAQKAFSEAECDDTYRPHFLADLAQAMRAMSRVEPHAPPHA